MLGAALRRMEFNVGDRVTLTSPLRRRVRGTLLRPSKRLFPGWIVKLDEPSLGRREGFFWEAGLMPEPPSHRDWLTPGQRVLITMTLRLRGRTGVLVRQIRLPSLRRGWVVRLDGPNERAVRIAEFALVPVAASVLTPAEKGKGGGQSAR